MRASYLVLIVSALCAECLPGVVSSPQEATTEELTRAIRKVEAAKIRQVLTQQQDAWNRGDIRGFMDGYVRGEKLRFASGGSVRRGWETTLKRYQTGYPDRATMGTLAFEDLEIQMLSRKWAEVFGRYRLTRKPPLENATGLFTLLVEQTPQGWRVLHDHTSADE